MTKIAAVKSRAIEGIALPLPAGGPWTVDQAFEFCLEIARNEPENSWIAYWYLGKTLRPHVATIYAFSRMLHDFAAEPQYEGQRDELIQAWEDALTDCFRGRSTHPVFIALAETVEKFDVPITPFQQLITGARMTANVRRFTSFQGLLTYCEKFANPHGRVILRLAGSEDIDDIRAADDLSTALMLAAFWTHLDRDFRRGRLHIPEEDLLRFGVTEADIKQQRVSREFQSLMDFELSRTRMYMMRGRPLCHHLPETLQKELQMIWFGVNVALDNIAKDGFDVFRRNHALRPVDWVRASARLAAWRFKDLTQW